jgi:predicted O-methyltransferase YrrM
MNTDASRSGGVPPDLADADLMAIKNRILRSLAQIVAPGDPARPLEIAEVGSWLGESAINWAAAIAEFNGGAGRVLCIDPWRPYDGRAGPAQRLAPEFARLLETGEAFELFRSNIRAAGIENLIEVHRAASDDALRALRGREFDLIYIDGDHTYRQVRADIENAQPLVRDGGILCGDDFELPFDKCNRALALKWAEIGAEYVYDPASGFWYHPGVTVALAAVFGKVSRRAQIWAMRKSGAAWLPVDFG